jgi:hypothetical protein
VDLAAGACVPGGSQLTATARQFEIHSNLTRQAVGEESGYEELRLPHSVSMGVEVDHPIIAEERKLVVHSS